MLHRSSFLLFTIIGRFKSLRSIAYCAEFNNCLHQSIFTLLLLLSLLLALTTSTQASEKNFMVDGVPNDADIRSLQLTGDGKTLFIGTRNGLFRYDLDSRDNKVLSVKGLPNGIFVTSLQLTRDSKTLFICTARNGLFRYDLDSRDNKALPINGVPNDTVIFSLQLTGDNKTLFIGTGNGLFRYDLDSQDNKALSVYVFPHFTIIFSLQLTRDSKTLFISTGGPVRTVGNGLFRYDLDSKDNKALSVEGLPNDASIYSLQLTWDSRTLFIGTGRGLFRYDLDSRDNKALPINGVPDGADIQLLQLTWDGKILFIGTARNGLFRYDLDSKDNKALSVEGLPNGLFVTSLQSSRDGKTLFISTRMGLFRFDFSELWDAHITFHNDWTDHRIGNQGGTTKIRWSIDHYDWHTTPDIVGQIVRVTVDDKLWKELPVRNVDRDDHDVFYCDVPLNKEGKYQITVVATDLMGHQYESPHDLFHPNSFIVTSKSPIERWFAWPVQWTVVLDVIAFIGLVFAARRNRNAFDILVNNQLARSAFPYMGLLLNYVPPFRKWLFARYFDRVKSDLGKRSHEYIPGEMRPSEGNPLQTDQMLAQIASPKFHPQLLVVGASGTGKSEMLETVMRQYCTAPSLSTALREHHVIPVMVRMRELGGKTVFELVQGALREKEMPFEDVKMVERLLRAGGFLVLLDGLNEVNLDNEVRAFARTYPSIRMIVTSQKVLENSPIPVYSLPPINEAFAKKLLRSYLPDKDAAHSIDLVAATLWVDIHSGYDVHLLSDLIKSGQPLPTSHLGLYDALLNYVVREAANLSLRGIICSAAWEFWKAGRRRFDRIYDVSEADWALLQDRNIQIVVRHGDKYEFRHDLLRGYLAAYYVTRLVANIGITCKQLKDDKIWGLPIDDQEVVFDFIAEMIGTQADLQQLAEFAFDELQIRGRLLSAVQSATGNIPLLLKIPDKGTLLSLNNVPRKEPSMTFNPFWGMPKQLPGGDFDVFMAMPFRTELQPVYEDHVKAAVRHANLTIRRGDDFFTANSIMQDVWSAICACHIVIADCTGKNPNVFYEMGIAHTIGKPIILISQNDEDVPFDLRHIRYIKYTYTPPGMKTFEGVLEKTLLATLEVASSKDRGAATGQP